MPFQKYLMVLRESVLMWVKAPFTFDGFNASLLNSFFQLRRTLISNGWSTRTWSNTSASGSNTTWPWCQTDHSPTTLLNWRYCSFYLCWWGSFCTTSCSSAETLHWQRFSFYFPLFCRHFILSICSLKRTTSLWRRMRRPKSKTSIRCLRYTHTIKHVAALAVFHSVLTVLFLTDVDRVWPYSVTSRTPSQWHREGVG